MNPLVCFSLTPEEHARLARNGPRRDIPLLAERLGARLLHSKGGVRRRHKWVSRVVGPHVRDAWAAAGLARQHSVVFVDGEHVGLPLLYFLALRRARRVRVVILAHFIDRPWKRALLFIGSRLVRRGVVIVHSSMQGEIARRALPSGWRTELLPYQVDTAFWTPMIECQPGRARIVAVGSEHRDYETLARAVDGLDVDATIAAGSHWARSLSSFRLLPENVAYVQTTLSFAELRQLYSDADVVVVPVRAVTNQSGVTTIMEAMSMGKAVITSATAGQREVVAGPLIRETGPDPRPTADRGPQTFGGEFEPRTTGWYVRPGDVAGLRRAIRDLAGDRQSRDDLGRAARRSVERNFGIEAFVERFAAVIESEATA